MRARLNLLNLVDCMGRLRTAPDRLTVAPGRFTFENRKEAERARHKARDTDAGSLRHLYRSKRWRDPVAGVRVKILRRDLFTCQWPGCGVALVGAYPAPDSPVVDHKRPHKGNLVRFWDENNLQALCKRCHDGAKQREDRASEGH